MGLANHFFGAKQAMALYENAFYSPLLSDWRNFETWQDDGAKTATQRVNKIWKQMLSDYEEPKFEASINDELDAFVAKGTSEGGVAPL